MILYVVRHGETIRNKLGLIQGQTEWDLTEKGIKDAEELRDTVDDLDIDIVISSPLKRAVDTARIITNNKYPINIDDRIIERDWGMCEGANIEEVDTVKCWNFFINTDDNVNDALIRVLPNIDIDSINGFIDNIDCMSKIRREFYKKIITFRYNILKKVYKRLKGD